MPASLWPWINDMRDMSASRGTICASGMAAYCGELATFRKVARSCSLSAFAGRWAGHQRGCLRSDHAGAAVCAPGWRPRDRVCMSAYSAAAQGVPLG